MNAEIGFAEYAFLFLLALLLFSPENLGKAFAKFKHYKGKLFKMKFDLEDAILEENSPEKMREKESAWIVQAVKNFPPYQSAKKVAAFYPLQNEPDILPLLEELASEGRLLLPRTFADGEMEFVEIHNLKTELLEGRFHVYEPAKNLAAYSGKIPFALVPGVQFSWDGGRHGHGKGYYDRFLARHPETLKCGIAFSAHVSTNPIPLMPHDIPMNYIVAVKNDPEKETPHVEKATV